MRRDVLRVCLAVQERLHANKLRRSLDSCQVLPFGDDKSCWISVGFLPFARCAKVLELVWIVLNIEQWLACDRADLWEVHALLEVHTDLLELKRSSTRT